MGRSRGLENGFGSRGKADEGRAREKGTKYSVDYVDTVSLDGCLNVEESIKLHLALAELAYSNSRHGSSENLCKEGSSPQGSSNNLLQGVSSPGGGFSGKLAKTPSQNQLSKLKLQSRTEVDIVSAKNSLSQLLRNPQGKVVEASKVLVMVTVVGSVGPLRVLLDAEASVQTVMGAALHVYQREGRLPALGLDSSWFDLYSGYISFGEALDPFQSLKPVNSRNFVMVKRQSQCEEVVRFREQKKKNGKPTSWLEDVWGFGAWWAKTVMAASPAFLQGTESKSAKAWLHELEAPPPAVRSF